MQILEQREVRPSCDDGVVRTKKYDVAVSIVTFHTDPGELSELLRSLTVQLSRLLVTVVDNSAKDDLRPIAECFGAQYLFLGSNIGFGAANNVALRRNLEAAPYQVVVNPDIVLSDGALDKLYLFMERHAEAGQVMPAICYPDGSEQRLTKRLPTPADLFLRRFLGRLGRNVASDLWARYEMRDLDMSVPREVPCLSGCFMFLRSTVLQQVGLFDERYFMYMEDVDLCRRVGDVSSTVFYPDVTVVHGYVKGSYKDLRLFRYHLHSGLRYFAKWGWLWDTTRRDRNRRTAAL